MPENAAANSNECKFHIRSILTRIPWNYFRDYMVSGLCGEFCVEFIEKRVE